MPAMGQESSIATFGAATDSFLQAYVAEGRVDYAAVKRAPKDLDRVVHLIEAMDRSSLAAAEEQAFLVNAYNVLTIKAVVAQYPINSPLEVEGFFDQAMHIVARQEMTLNDLEKKDLFGKFPDARLHFVLVCAAQGCPILISEVYTPSLLNEQLDRQTRLALNSPQHVRLDPTARKVFVSELFSWYEQDFTREGSVIDFINGYRNEPIPADYSVEYIPYDWSLNDNSKGQEGSK